MQSREVPVHTGAHRGVHDLTDACEAFLADVADGGDGLLSILAPHATAAVVVIELGSGSDEDLIDTIDRLLPRDERWRHRHGSRGHDADHLVPAFLSPSVTVPVLAGRLAIGTWQRIALLDPNQDNAERRVRLSFVAG